MLGIVKKDSVFISCTSEDKEFRSLLRAVANQNVVYVDTLSDIVCLSRNGSKILILQGRPVEGQITGYDLSIRAT